MKVLFLTRYPVDGASSRYRVYQYLPEFRKMDVGTQVSSFMTRAMYRRAFSPNGRFMKLLYTLFSVARRVFSVCFAWRFDVVVIQRELLPFGPPILERAIGYMGVATVFDYDDALFVHKDSKFNALATRFRRPEKTIEILSMVSAVSAGNRYLTSVAKKYCDNSFCVEVAEDTGRIPLRSYREDGPIVIGWLGSKTTEKYLELIRPALEHLFQSNENIQMKVIGGGEFRLDSTDVIHVDWDLDSEVEQLLSFDIGLMPLPLEEWSQGKSGGKARTYMAAGVVPVCTAIGYNLELIDHGHTGYLVTTENEWLDVLDRLIASSEQRKKVGMAARQAVVERFSLEGQAKILKHVFDVAIAEQAK